MSFAAISLPRSVVAICIWLVFSVFVLKLAAQAQPESIVLDVMKDLKIVESEEVPLVVRQGAGKTLLPPEILKGISSDIELQTEWYLHTDGHYEYYYTASQGNNGVSYSVFEVLDASGNLLSRRTTMDALPALSQILDPELYQQMVDDYQERSTAGEWGFCLETKGGKTYYLFEDHILVAPRQYFYDLTGKFLYNQPLSFK